MSLVPLVLNDETSIKMSKIIFFTSYVLMSKLRESIGLTDVTDQYTKLDIYFWLYFILSLSSLYGLFSIHEKVHKANKLIGWWHIILLILLNQSNFQKIG